MQRRETTKSAVNKNDKAKVSLSNYYFLYLSSGAVAFSFVCSAISSFHLLSSELYLRRHTIHAEISDVSLFFSVVVDVFTC